MSFVRVTVKPDTLDDENRKFTQQPLGQPLFLNSVPKSGSHLLRNIIRMFVPVDSQYDAQFIQYHFLQQHLAAFDPRRNMLSWGHLFHMDATKAALAGVRHIILVRDPYQWVLAQARFLLSNEFQAPGFEPLKRPDVPVELVLDLVIEGRKPQLPPLAVTYHFNAVAWLDSGVHLVRYEDLIRALGDLESEATEKYFTDLLKACGIARPEDWRDRVRIGSDRKQSGTARENLTGVALKIPETLPDLQKRRIDFVAPGLRALLGYE
ncbi:MAG: hypothetical protein ACJ8E6_08955 [Sphingomicrobium sp.]